MSEMIQQRNRNLRDSDARPNWCVRVALVMRACDCMGGTCSAQAPPARSRQVLPRVGRPRACAEIRSGIFRQIFRPDLQGIRDAVCVERQRAHAFTAKTPPTTINFKPRSASGTLKFNETRETRNPAFRDPARTLLVTTGFASLLLVAHPMYEASYMFEPAGDETIDGVPYAKIHFTPVPGAASPASLRLRGKNYPLPMSGTLWVDPQTGAIVKLEANVDYSLSDLGLAGMRSEVHYALAHFP